MSGLRDQPGIPHKNWVCIDVEDLDSATGVCEMCGREQIRFVHCMEHPEYHQCLGVGCVCAEKMSDDYTNPRLLEQKLKNKTSRKSRWLTRKWRISRKGNPFLNVDGKNITVFQYKNGCKKGEWGYMIDNSFGPKAYNTESEAKIAAYDKFFGHEE